MIGWIILLVVIIVVVWVVVLYNAVVRDFNTRTEVFPSNLIANVFQFQQFDYFLLPSETEAEIRETPQVKFR